MVFGPSLLSWKVRLSRWAAKFKLSPRLVGFSRTVDAMDDATAFRLFESGQPVSLIVNGKQEDGVLITGLNLPGSMSLLLRTRIGEPDRRMTLPMNKVEEAP